MHQLSVCRTVPGSSSARALRGKVWGYIGHQLGQLLLILCTSCWCQNKSLQPQPDQVPVTPERSTNPPWWIMPYLPPCVNSRPKGSWWVGERNRRPAGYSGCLACNSASTRTLDPAYCVPRLLYTPLYPLSLGLIESTP